MSMIDFKTVRVGKAFHEIVLDICKITQQFSLEALYGLTGQMRRSVVSVPTDIAEGCG